MRRSGTQFVLVAFAPVAMAAALALPASAAERVTLTNGFEISCNHHSLVEGRYRLYTSRDTGSFIEFDPARISAIETVPDPPAEPDPEPGIDSAHVSATQSSASRSSAGPAIATLPAPEPKLTPADLRQMLSTAGSAHNVDADLLASVVKAESNGNAHAVSRAGARGLMQLMPGTAADLGVQDSFRPDQNVRGGSAYLDSLLTKYHDNLGMALAAYNAGPAAVDKYHGIPPYRETRQYVARVIHEFNRRVRDRQHLASSGQ